MSLRDFLKQRTETGNEKILQVNLWYRTSQNIWDEGRTVGETYNTRENFNKEYNII